MLSLLFVFSLILSHPMPLIINPHFAILYLYLSLFFVLFIYLFIWFLVFVFCFFSFLFFMNICMCCFMHYVATSSNTLSLWTTKCIFLGYSKLKKGYKCFDPTLGRYLISADATIFLVSLGFSVKRVDS